MPMVRAVAEPTTLKFFEENLGLFAAVSSGRCFTSSLVGRLVGR